MFEAFDDVVSEPRIHSVAEHAALRRYERETFTIECPLSTGAVVWRAYWRDGRAAKAAGGLSLPYAPGDPWAGARR
jgi:hypothetical protein